MPTTNKGKIQRDFNSGVTDFRQVKELMRAMDPKAMREFEGRVIGSKVQEAPPRVSSKKIKGGTAHTIRTRPKVGKPGDKPSNRAVRPPGEDRPSNRAVKK